MSDNRRSGLFVIFHPALTKAYRKRGCGVGEVRRFYADEASAGHEVSRFTCYSWGQAEAEARRSGAVILTPPGFKWRQENRAFDWAAYSTADLAKATDGDRYDSFVESFR